jgi:bacterioferritin
MNGGAESPALLALLNDALSRELQVSMQYMLQHAFQAGLERGRPRDAGRDPRAAFIASHRFVLTGATLKKIAITEMRHAEAIAERIALLNVAPTTQPHALAMGATSLEMLQNDLAAEQEAIDLYSQIVATSDAALDAITADLFRRILSDERKHRETFSKLLA